MAKTSYILGKRINRGGMAEIFIGKAVGEDAFERICAIKRILPHYAQDNEYIKMFRDEAHICKRLQHANIVQVYDFSEVEESFAIVMEYVDGADLRTLLSACEDLHLRIPVSMAIYIAACAARGLHYAHTKTDEISNRPLEIIHRDISPQNLLVSYEGEVKVTDFGIASATAENKIAETKAGVVKGKYSYMSPEQVTAKKLDARSDIFSLAVVLWEALAMKRLFLGQNEIDTIRKVQSCEIVEKLTDLNSEVDDKLLAIVMKGLAADRKKRYQTAAAFDKALSRYLHSRYPDFLASELGDFLKQKLANKRAETIATIKETLSLSRPDTDSEQLSKRTPKFEAQAGRQQLEPRVSRPEAEERDHAQVLPLLDSQRTASSIQGQRATGASLGVRRHTVGKNPGGYSVGAAAGQYVRPLPHGRTVGNSAVKRRPSPGHTSYKRASIQRRRYLIMVVAVVVAVGAFFFKENSFFEKKMSVQVQTVPSSVTMTINGVPVKGGAYVRTPLNLDLKPGRHTMLIRRPGYVSESLELQGAAGDHLPVRKVFLRRKAGIKLMPIKIVSDEPNITVSLDNGFAKGTLPMMVLEVEADKLHTITIIDSKDGGKPSSCSFKTPTNPSKEAPLTLKVLFDGHRTPICQRILSPN